MTCVRGKVEYRKVPVGSDKARALAPQLALGDKEAANHPPGSVLSRRAPEGVSDVLCK